MNGSTIDWNYHGVIDDPTPVNINGNGNDEFDTLNGTLNLLYGRSDWDKIVLKIGCPDYGIADDFSFQDKFSVTSELDNCPEHDDIRAQFGKDVDDRYPPEVPFMGEACDNEDNDEDGLVDEGCPDTDNDGIVDDLDNCIYISNPDQLDYNHDFIGDACLNNLPMHNIQQELVADSKEPNPEEDTSYDHVNFKDWVIIAIFFVVIIFLVIIWKIMKRKH